MIFWHKFRRNLQDFGFRITVEKALRYPFRWLFYTIDYRIYRIDLKTSGSPALKDESVTYRWLTTGDQTLIAEIEAMEEWLRGKVAPLLHRGGICLVAADHEKLAGFNLIGFEWVDMPTIEHRRYFRSGTAWSIQISVSSDFRGQGVASNLRYRVFAELRRRGIRWFYGGAITNNEASLKLAKRVGFSEIADIRFRKCFGRRSWHYHRLPSRS